MSNNPPVTIWEGADGSEITPSSNLKIDTEAGLDLITEAGLILIQEDSIDTPKPVTIWSTNNSI